MVDLEREKDLRDRGGSHQHRAIKEQEELQRRLNYVEQKLEYHVALKN